MRIIDDVLDEIKMACVLFATGSLGCPTRHKPTRKGRPFRVMPRWQRQPAMNGCGASVSSPTEVTRHLPEEI